MSLNRFPPRRSVPLDYAGKWIAWNRQQTEIIGSGSTFDEAKQAAEDAGECQVILAKLPPISTLRAVSHPSIYEVAVFISPPAHEVRAPAYARSS